MEEINSIDDAIKVFNSYDINEFKPTLKEVPHSYNGHIPDDNAFTAYWILYNNVIFNSINKLIFFIAQLRIWSKIFSSYKINKETLNNIVCYFVDPIREQCIDIPLMLCNNLQKSLILLEEIHNGDLDELEISLELEKKWRMNNWINKWNKFDFSNEKAAEEISTLLEKIYKGALADLHGYKQHGILKHYSIGLPEVFIKTDNGSKVPFYRLKKNANINEEIDLFVDVLNQISECYSSWFNYIDLHLSNNIYGHFTKLSGLSGSTK